MGGLIGVIEDDGGTVTVRNCWVTGGDIFAFDDDVRAGGLIGGHINSTRPLIVSNSFSTVDIEVEGEDCHVGGLIGSIESNAISTVRNSYATGNVSVSGDFSFVGGLIGAVEGRATSTIFNSYAAGVVEGFGYQTKAGGLIGHEFRSLSARPIEIINSYRLEYTVTGIDDGNENYSGTPLSANAMRTRASFVNWDFELIWSIEEGVTFPTLQMSDINLDIDDGTIGIDYSAEDIILFGSINGIENRNYFINLTNETITLPEDYTIAAYSVDGGINWRRTTQRAFNNRLLANLLNRGMTLAITDRHDTRNRRANNDADDDNDDGRSAEIITFPAIQARPRVPTALVVNYLVREDRTANTSGQWVLSPRGSSTAMKDNIEIALSDRRGRLSESGWGRFFDDRGVQVSSPSGRRQITRTYIWRIAPTEYRAGSRPRRVTVRGLRPAPNHSVNRRTTQINIRAGSSVLMVGDTEPRRFDSATVIDITNYTGRMEIWLNANDRQPASERRILYITN